MAEKTVPPGIARLKKQFELHDRTIQALLLQFRKKIKNGNRIPSPHRIGEILKSIPKEQRDNFQQRVREGLYHILARGISGPEESENYLEGYMFSRGYGEKVLEWDWIDWFGDLFKFRRGKRKEAVEEVRGYWNEKELADFQKIGQVLREETAREYQPKIERHG